MSDSTQLLGPGEGEAPRDGEFTIKCGRDQLVLSEAQHVAGQGEPAPHIHRQHADAFYMLEGELLCRVADGEHLVGPGDFVFAPPGLVHSYRSPGDEGCRFINIHAPGMGFDDRLRGLLDEFDQHPPPEDGGLPASEGVLLRRGEGELIDLGQGTHGRIKAGAEDGLGLGHRARVRARSRGGRAAAASPCRDHRLVLRARRHFDGAARR